VKIVVAPGIRSRLDQPSAVESRRSYKSRWLAPGAIVLLHEGAAHGGNVDTIRLLLRLGALGYRTTLPSPL
jgi:hypothetical protein